MRCSEMTNLSNIRDPLSFYWRVHATFGTLFTWIDRLCRSIFNASICPAEPLSLVSSTSVASRQRPFNVAFYSHSTTSTCRGFDSQFPGADQHCNVTKRPLLCSTQLTRSLRLSRRPVSYHLHEDVFQDMSLIYKLFLL